MLNNDLLFERTSAKVNTGQEARQFFEMPVSQFIYDAPTSMGFTYSYIFFHIWL